MNFIIQWIDVIWLPLAWAVAHEKQRWWALGCVLLSMIMMRLMAELMESIHYPNGIIGLMTTGVRGRGVAVYSFYYMAYLLFAHYSPRREGWLFMGVSMSVFFAAALTFALVMVL